MPDTTNPQPDRYRQRPNEVDAIQWTGDNADALRAFAGIDFDTIDPADRIDDPDCDAQLLVEASHWVGIRPGDWVLKFEGYFVAKDDGPFRAVWEPAVPSAPTDRAAEEVDADTVASRAAQVITNMGADIRALTKQRDRYRTAWCSARERAQAYGEGILRHVADRDFWKRQCKAAERIRENADFHLGQEMARRQLAEKETARLRADRPAVLREAADAVAKLREKTDINVAEYQRYDFRQRVALGDAEGLLRRVAVEAPAPNRAGDETQQGEAEADVFELPGPEVVAYRNPDRPSVLLCREHGDGWWGLTPLTADDLPDGGTCTYGDPADPGDVCGVDVLIPQLPTA